MPSDIRCRQHLQREAKYFVAAVSQGCPINMTTCTGKGACKMASVHGRKTRDTYGITITTNHPNMNDLSLHIVKHALFQLGGLVLRLSRIGSKWEDWST